MDFSKLEGEFTASVEQIAALGERVRCASIKTEAGRSMGVQRTFTFAPPLPLDSLPPHLPHSLL